MSGPDPAPVRLAGRDVTVRHVRSSDLPALIDLYESLSDDDTYHRFFSGAPPVRELVEHWVEAAQADAFRLVAATVGGAIVADAGFAPIVEGEWAGDAEFDMTVDATARGWFGSFLLDQLVDEARRRDVRNFHAHILRDNRAMLAVATRRGYVILDHDEPTEMHIAMGVREAMPVWPEHHEHLRVVVESRADGWSAAASARSYGMTAVVCPGPRPGPRPRCAAADGRPCSLAAEADVLVHALPDDDERARRVLLAHGQLHPRALVVVEEWSDEVREVLPAAARLERGDPLAAEVLLRALGRDPQLPQRAPPPQSGDDSTR